MRKPPIVTLDELVNARNVLTNIKNWNFDTCGPYKIQKPEAENLKAIEPIIKYLIEGEII